MEKNIPQDIQDKATELYPPHQFSGDTSRVDVNKSGRDIYVRGRLEERESMFEFIEWLPRNAQPKSINRNWILNADKKEYTLQKLFEIWERTK